MKSLLEVQQDIRGLEQQLRGIAHTIKMIHSDIEKIRTANQDTNLDYSKIVLLAKRFPFRNHPLGKLTDEKACRVYLAMLLNIVRLDTEEEVSLNRFVFIQWLQMESGIERSIEDIFKDCYKISSHSYQEMLDILPEKYWEYLVVDALIIANIGGAANTEINEYIAGLVSILGIEKERLHILSFVARIALCQNIHRMKKAEIDAVQKCAKAYKHYINAAILENGIKSLRQIIVQLPDDEVRNFKWKVRQGQSVKKDDVLAVYSRVVRNRGVSYSTHYATEEVKSPSEGTIYQFRDNCINYGVLASEADNKDSIKAWVQAKQ